MFTRADSNHDGYVTEDEMKAAHAAMAADMDRDDDKDMDDKGDAKDGP
jgi:hypothetical protein